MWECGISCATCGSIVRPVHGLNLLKARWARDWIFCFIEIELGLVLSLWISRLRLLSWGVLALFRAKWLGLEGFDHGYFSLLWGFIIFTCARALG